MPLLVVRNLLCKLGHEVRSFGTRAYKAHLATQDVPELRNLIDANLAYHTAHARGSIVVFTGPHRSCRLSINSHRAKLCQHKMAAVLADPFLLVEHRTARIELDQNCCDSHYRQREK